MTIDLNIYNEMKDDELNLISSYVASIQENRRQENQQMFSEPNLLKIEHYLKEHDYHIPEEYLDWIDLTHLTSTTFELFKLLKSSLNWKNKLLKGCHFFVDIVKDINLLKQYHDYIQEDLIAYSHIFEYNLYADLPLENIEFLFNKETITVEDFHHFKMDFNNSSTLALFMFEHHFLHLNAYQLKQAYIHIYLDFPDKIEFAQLHYPELKSLTFTEYLHYSDMLHWTSNPLKKFLIYEDNVILTIWHEFPLKSEHISLIVQELEKIVPLHHKIFLLVSHVKYYQPDLISDLHKSIEQCDSMLFKKLFNDALLLIHLDETLQTKEPQYSHKI